MEKREVASDGRATTGQLTAEGRRQFPAMARAHQARVVELFVALNAAQLFELLGLLKGTIAEPR